MVLALPALVAGCVVGPHYRAPELATAARFTEPAAGPASSAAVNGPINEWWTRLGDPQLNSLIARALAANLDLETAASRVRAARLQEISAGAAYWPSVKANGAAQRSRLSENAISLGGLGGGAGSTSAASLGFGLPGTEFNTFQIGFDASWQLDFFGRTRRNVAATDADAAAAIWDLRDTQVSIAAEVAGTYLGMRYTEERIRIAQSELSRLEQTLHLLEVRASGGLASQLDVRQQQTEVAASAARLPLLESQARLQNHALAVLLGEAPEPAVGAAPSSTGHTARRASHCRGDGPHRRCGCRSLSAIQPDRIAFSFLIHVQQTTGEWQRRLFPGCIGRLAAVQCRSDPRQH
jgi:outer membrane protein, multidrug efflux system